MVLMWLLIVMITEFTLIVMMSLIMNMSPDGVSNFDLKVMMMAGMHVLSEDLGDRPVNLFTVWARTSHTD